MLTVSLYDYTIGWLLRQLETQADGLSGALPHFWSDIQSSSWVGGQSDSGLHERTPYWLNGFVPLAYQLNNDTYRQTVRSDHSSTTILSLTLYSSGRAIYVIHTGSSN